MIRKERKLEGGRSGSENGGKWISEQKEAFVQCSLERDKGCRGERAAGVRRAPSPRGEEGVGTHRHIHTWGAHSAWFCCIPAQSCHGWTYSDAVLGTGQGEGRGPWLKERFPPRLLQTTAPPDQGSPHSPCWKHPNPSVLPVYLQTAWDGDRGARGRLRQQTAELEGRSLSILNAHLKC